MNSRCKKDMTHFIAHKQLGKKLAILKQFDLFVYKRKLIDTFLKANLKASKRTPFINKQGQLINDFLGGAF